MHKGYCMVKDNSRQYKESKRYRLGLKLLEYTYIINKNLSYQNTAYDIISYVAKELSFITYFAVPQKA